MKVNNLEFADVFSTENQHIIICGQYDYFIPRMIFTKKMPETIEVFKNRIVVEKHHVTSFQCDGVNVHCFGWDAKNSYLSTVMLIEAIDKLQFQAAASSNCLRVSVLMPGEGTAYCLKEGDNRLLIAALLLEAKVNGIDLYMNPKDQIHYETIVNTLTTTMQLSRQ